MLEVLKKISKAEMLEASETIFGKDSFSYDSDTTEESIRQAIVDWLKERKLYAEGTETESDELLDKWVLKRVAAKLGVEVSREKQEEIEDIIATRIMEKLEEKISNMSPKERKEFYKKLKVHIEKEFGSAKALKIGAGATAFVVGGKLTGFGIFLATATGLKVLSGLLGVTFAWSVYQTATTLLGIMLGPVGWIISGGTLLGGFGKWAVERNWQRMIAFTTYCIFKKRELKLKTPSGRIERLPKRIKSFFKRGTDH